ncbi:MAG: hypothetical protein O9253_00990 [Aquidulcibacter sp.]|nr:hypothetical protein [Aquidulcibacter sp.]
MSASSGYSDIDAMTLQVRNRQSRQLIGEAITAYRGGALRSAIISTWIAVAADIIAKARELAGQDEAGPRIFVHELDAAIAAEDIRKLQLIESDLLRMANVDLQLLATHEHSALARLQQDRHLCAHPAFVAEDQLYQPSPELVRAHIVHALQHLLVNAPLQGKSAIARFDADLLSPAFPAAADDIGVFMRSKYLDRAKEVLVVNLTKAIVSMPFGAERAKYVSKARTLAVILREIAKAKTAIYDSVMPGYIAEKFEQIPSDVLLTICPYLEGDPRIWEWLKEPDQTRVRRLLETADVETLKTHAAFDALAIAPLSEALVGRFNGFDATTKISIIAEHPRTEFIAPALEIYRNAGSYRSAEQLGQSVILPLAPFYTALDLQAVLDAVVDNGQIWDAAGTPEILKTLFDRTRPLLPASRGHWEAFLKALGFRNRQGYAGLQERLDQNP